MDFCTLLKICGIIYLLSLGFALTEVYAQQGAVQGGLRDYSVPPVGVTGQCPTATHTCTLTQSSTASAGTIVGTSTTGTNFQIKWANGQFPQALVCTANGANAAGLALGVLQTAVTYAANVPTLTITAETTQASANINYICVGQ